MASLNLDYLRTFVTVIERGSFSAAAQRLDLTQPAVSLQIRQLERRLGSQLIERIGRKAQPTSAGAELLAHAAQIEAAVSAALDAVARHADSAMGRVRLGTGATACIFLLPPVLRDLRKAHPDLEITVSTGNTPAIVKDIEENVIDVGLVTLPVAGRMLDVTPVLDDEFVLIAPAGAQPPARITAGSIADKPLLLFEPGANTRRIIDEWFARSGVALKPVMSLGSVEAIKELVLAGMGWAILPALALRQSKPQRPLVVRPLSPRLTRRLGVVIRRDKRLHRGLRETIHALKRLANA